LYKDCILQYKKQSRLELVGSFLYGQATVLPDPDPDPRNKLIPDEEVSIADPLDDLLYCVRNIYILHARDACGSAIYGQRELVVVEGVHIRVEGAFRHESP
jgi:hypothetical protein